MASLQKPWKAEYAKSGGSTCKTCKTLIPKDKLRLGIMVQATRFDGNINIWNHDTCILEKEKQIKSCDDVEGIETLRWEDQQKIREYIVKDGGTGSQTSPPPAPPSPSPDATKCRIEVSKSARATCEKCNVKIMPGEVRISSEAEGPSVRGLTWHHAICFMDSFPSTQPEILVGWESMLDSHKSTFLSMINYKVSDTKKGKNNVKEDKTEDDPLTPKQSKNSNNPRDSLLEAQTKQLWALKDDLKTHVTSSEMLEMLKTNNQDSLGRAYDELRDRCADGMLFGALKKCVHGCGHLRYSGDAYKCKGYMTGWSKCSYSTLEPERVKGKWNIPENTDNKYLLKWFKTQKLEKPVRIMPLPNLSACSTHDPVREDYLQVDSFKKQMKLGFYHLYKTEEESKIMMTVKVKGRSAVHEASGLQDSGHILEHGESIYNTTLSLSDLSTGQNSYYILQIIEDDKGAGCYVFRNWGRVDNKDIGDNKLEGMRSKSDAIQEFKRLFLKHSGNPWEMWEHNKVQKQPGKLYPLDIHYMVNQDYSHVKDAESQLAPPLQELIRMLFNVETYRTIMMEFEIDMVKMPLGKLSETYIQNGFQVLTDLQNLLKEPTTPDNQMMIVDASNRFFTLIPSIRRHVIEDEDDLKSKVKMLESLRDIEIASRIVGFNADNDDYSSLDDKYKKLQCELVPLPHDSEDYQLVDKYLQTTHGPTHTKWTLELEEVFTVERQGEFDKYVPYKNKLKNKMLLWHGSRLTNYVGILSQGLQIAPPEAPVTGYMFGKGIYFADLASKSADYCKTEKENPVGLMLLSEVALGEMYELTKGEYMDKPPVGNDSTKGLGKSIPNESEHVKWREDVIVPCGKVVSSNHVKKSKLLYNEYIVYNTDQVKLQFLLKVRFHHKK